MRQRWQRLDSPDFWEVNVSVCLCATATRVVEDFIHFSEYYLQAVTRFLSPRYWNAPEFWTRRLRLSDKLALTEKEPQCKHALFINQGTEEFWWTWAVADGLFGRFEHQDKDL